MASRVWSHLCDYATVDPNGKTTIVGEFDNIFAQALPVQYPLFFVVSKWSGSNGESFTHQIRISAPSRREILKSQLINITIQGMDNSDGSHINIDTFMMFPITEFGEYSIEILINGNLVHILPFFVIQRTA
jgi:hypothetical protein